MRLLARILMIATAAALVAAAALALLGLPSLDRNYARNEIARFAPTWGHGIGQFLGETSLLCLFTYIGRRWLRVRL